MAGIEFQDSAIENLRLGQLTGLMALGGGDKQGGDGR